MKKIIALVLTFVLLASVLCACQPNDTTTTEQGGEETTPVGEPEVTTPEVTTPEVTTPDVTTKEESKEEAVLGKQALSGKKIIFIGNSHTYYGNAVVQKNEDVLTQSARSNDKGYFYRICKSNGISVSVTNWTFPGHYLTDLFGGECYRKDACQGVDHASYLTDRYFDYVVIQQATSNLSKEDFCASVQLVMDVFKAENPNVKFVFVVQRNVHEHNYGWLEELKNLEEQGVIIADWGALVDDLITGKTTVPGATQTYNKNSFIVCRSSSDGYHPNMLTGYITSLMTYCAITGESAVGQAYSFCTDSSLSAFFSVDKYLGKHYTYKNATTNFPAIFASEADMTGIQTLIDTYLREKPYLNHGAN